jgi:prepilin-type N-terminal cleavage/methylation domain-containing protein
MIRAGVTLTEVLVAAVLLAVGVAGCLGALSTAVRLRTGAAAREAMAAATHDRLTWFEANGCAAGDTSISGPAGVNATEDWQVTSDASTAHMSGGVRGRVAGIAFGVAIATRRGCE